MRVTWFGQSSYLLEGPEGDLFIDPWADMSAAASRGIEWNYPPIEGVRADLLLVTHEHADHNGVEAIAGDPAILRSTAGTHDSPFGAVTGVASEHDDVAGTQRGPNTLFALAFDGLRVVHLGDLGQPRLRPEQVAALGAVDLLFVPAGDGPVLGAAAAREVTDQLSPTWVVPMHFRTAAINFLEPADAFVATFGDDVVALDTPTFDTAELPTAGGPVVVVPATPGF